MELGEERRDEMKMRIDEILHRQFKPEFLNRIDEIITFHGLSREDLAQIVDIQVGLLRKRLADQKFTIDLTDTAREFIINVGYNPAFGARPLKRAMQRYIQDGLAMEILEGKIREGDHIVVDQVSGEERLSFRKK